MFHDEETNDLKATDVIEHELTVANDTPIRRPKYRIPYALRGEMKNQIENMLSKGVIKECVSP